MNAIPSCDTASDTPPLIELRDVCVWHRISGGGLFQHQTVYALSHADLTVRAGETVGIVGESGCGKSTLAKALVGLQPPTQGEILFRGQSLWAMTPEQRRNQFGGSVGMVFQDPSTALNRRLSVRQVIRDPLDVHRRGNAAEREARVIALMEMVGLPTSALDALPTQLSGGQRQRVAIARALALGPALLIADEPTSALDVSVRAQILNLLTELQQRFNLGIVFISHDLQTVRRMSDRIVTMYLGRIVEEVPAAQLSRGVAHPYTRALLSATPGILHPAEPIALDGPVPSATQPPSGCAFRTRCWKSTEACAQALPERRVLSPGHAVRCLDPESGTV